MSVIGTLPPGWRLRAFWSHRQRDIRLFGRRVNGWGGTMQGNRVKEYVTNG